MSETESITFKAGFEFARRLRHKDFRDYLTSNGWHNGDHVLMVTDNDPVIEVVSRLGLHQRTGGRAVIAIVDNDHTFGFRLLVAMTAKRRLSDLFSRDDRLQLAPGASIGMLYSLLSPSGTYVPNEWTRMLRFERAAT